jgi:ribosomal protein S27E
MKVDWRTHPDNIGHFYSLGCFRCHDNQHVSKSGKVIAKDCHICHDVLSEAVSGSPMFSMPKNEFQHPVDLGDMTAVTCADCHTGKPMG